MFNFLKSKGTLGKKRKSSKNVTVIEEKNLQNKFEDLYGWKSSKNKKPRKDILIGIELEITFIGGIDSNYVESGDDKIFFKFECNKQTHHTSHINHTKNFIFPEEEKKKFMIKKKQQSSSINALATIEMKKVTISDGVSTMPKTIMTERIMLKNEDFSKVGEKKKFSIKGGKVEFEIEKVREVWGKERILITTVSSLSTGDVKTSVIFEGETIRSLHRLLEKDKKENITKILRVDGEEKVELKTDEDVCKLTDKCVIHVKFKRPKKSAKEMMEVLGKYIAHLSSLCNQMFDPTKDISPNSKEALKCIQRVNKHVDYKNHVLFKELYPEEMNEIDKELNVLQEILQRAENVDKSKGYKYVEILKKEIDTDLTFQKVKQNIVDRMKSKCAPTSFSGFRRTRKKQVRRKSFKFGKGLFQSKKGSRGIKQLVGPSTVSMEEYQKKLDSLSIIKLKNPKVKISKVQEKKFMELIKKFKGVKLIPYKELQLNGIIYDQGDKSIVFKGLYKNEVVVYKKYQVTLDSLLASTETQEDFEKELKIFQICKHPNILRLIGLVFDIEKEVNIGIVVEFCEYGDLRQFIKNNKLDMEEKVRILYDVAKVMQYLHHKKIIHRDLKLGNVLVSDDMSVKLMDFGISKLVGKNSIGRSKTSAIGTPYYMAPEQFKKKYNEKVDVFAFAIFTYILITENFNPYRKKDKKYKSKEKMSAGEFIANITQDENFRPKWKNKYLGKGYLWVKDICMSCWAFHPNKRPSFEEVLERFDAKMKNFNYKSSTIRLERRNTRVDSTPVIKSPVELMNEKIQRSINVSIYLKGDKIENSVEVTLEKCTMEEIKEIVRKTLKKEVVSITEIDDDEKPAQIIDKDSKVRFLNPDALLQIEYTDLKKEEQKMPPKAKKHKTSKTVYLTLNCEGKDAFAIEMTTFTMDALYELVKKNFDEVESDDDILNIYFNKKGYNLKIISDDKLMDMKYSKEKVVIYVETVKTIYFKEKDVEEEELKDEELKDRTVKGLWKLIHGRNEWRGREIKKISIEDENKEIVTNKDVELLEDDTILIVEFARSPEDMEKEIKMLEHELSELKGKKKEPLMSIVEKKPNFLFCDVKLIPIDFETNGIKRKGIVVQFNDEWDLQVYDNDKKLVSYMPVMLKESNLEKFEIYIKKFSFSSLAKMKKDELFNILKENSKDDNEMFFKRIESDFIAIKKHL